MTPQNKVSPGDQAGPLGVHVTMDLGGTASKVWFSTNDLDYKHKGRG